MIIEKGVLDYDILSALVSQGTYTSSPNLEIRKSNKECILVSQCR